MKKTIIPVAMIAIGFTACNKQVTIAPSQTLTEKQFVSGISPTLLYTDANGCSGSGSDCLAEIVVTPSTNQRFKKFMWDIVPYVSSSSSVTREYSTSISDLEYFNDPQTGQTHINDFLTDNNLSQAQFNSLTIGQYVGNFIPGLSNTTINYVVTLNNTRIEQIKSNGLYYVKIGPKNSNVNSNPGLVLQLREQ